MKEIHEIPSGIDVKVIGSDSSMRAIKAAIQNCEKAGVHNYKYLAQTDREISVNPMIYSYHAPKKQF